MDASKRTSNPEDEIPIMTHVRKLLRDMPFLSCTSCGLGSSSDCYDAMPLRMGIPLCMKHIAGFPGFTDPVTSFLRAIPVKMAFVFLDFEVEPRSSGRAWQVGAVMCSGASFTALIKLPFDAIPARLTAASATLEQRLVMRSAYKITAEAERTFMAKLVKWIMSQARTILAGDGVTSAEVSEMNVVIVSHYGAQHDFIVLANALRRSSIPFPNFIVCDSVLMFKLLLGTNVYCSLAALKEIFILDRYLPPDDAEANAEALWRITTSQSSWQTKVLSVSTPMHALLHSCGFWSGTMIDTWACSTPADAALGISGSSTPYGHGKGTYDSKQALWATMLVSYLAMVIDACAQKSATTPAIDVSYVTSRITLSIGYMHVAQTTLELPPLADDASRYARCFMRRNTSKDVPSTTADLWMTFRHTPQGRRIMTVVANCIAAYARIPWMVGWPCSTIVPFIKPELVEMVDGYSTVMPAIGKEFAREEFRQANSAEMFFSGMSRDVVRRLSSSIMTRRMDVTAALNDCGLELPPETIRIP
ncbi:hypothetical protein MMPV_008130 [Pyropia vietnamensis]